MAAIAFVCIAVPLPLWAMYVAIAVLGFSIGVATTLSITGVVDIAPPHARGTANSIRIMLNRIGQAVIPASAGLVAAAAGVGGIMLMLAAGLAVSASAVQWSRPRGKD